MLVACSESWVALPVFDDAEDLSEFVEHRAAFRCISMWLEQWPKVVEIVKQPDAARDNASLGTFADLGVNAESFARSKCCQQDAGIASCAQLLNEICANHSAPVMKMGFQTTLRPRNSTSILLLAKPVPLYCPCGSLGSINTLLRCSSRTLVLV